MLMFLEGGDYMEVLKTIGRVVLVLLKILVALALWILKAALEVAKFLLILLGLLLRITFAIIRSSSEF